MGLTNVENTMKKQNKFYPVEDDARGTKKKTKKLAYSYMETCNGLDVYDCMYF